MASLGLITAGAERLVECTICKLDVQIYIEND